MKRWLTSSDMPSSLRPLPSSTNLPHATRGIASSGSNVRSCESEVMSNQGRLVMKMRFFPSMLMSIKQSCSRLRRFASRQNSVMSPSQGMVTI